MHPKTNKITLRLYIKDGPSTLVDFIDWVGTCWGWGSFCTSVLGSWFVPAGERGGVFFFFVYFQPLFWQFLIQFLSYLSQKKMITLRLYRSFSLALEKNIVSSANCKFPLALLLHTKMPCKIPLSSTLNIKLLIYNNDKKEMGEGLPWLKPLDSSTHPLAHPFNYTAKLTDEMHPWIHDLYLQPKFFLFNDEPKNPIAHNHKFFQNQSQRNSFLSKMSFSSTTPFTTKTTFKICLSSTKLPKNYE